LKSVELFYESGVSKVKILRGSQTRGEVSRETEEKKKGSWGSENIPKRGGPRHKSTFQ